MPSALAQQQQRDQRFANASFAAEPATAGVLVRLSTRYNVNLCHLAPRAGMPSSSSILQMSRVYTSAS